MPARDVQKVEVNAGKNGFMQKKYQGGQSIYTEEIKGFSCLAYDLEDERAISAYDLETTPLS